MYSFTHSVLLSRSTAVQVLLYVRRAYYMSCILYTIYTRRWLYGCFTGQRAGLLYKCRAVAYVRQAPVCDDGRLEVSTREQQQWGILPVSIACKNDRTGHYSVPTMLLNRGTEQRATQKPVLVNYCSALYHPFFHW